MSTDQDSDQSDQSEHSSDHSSNQQSPKGARKKGRFVDPIEADSMPMPNLPHDIVIEILTRLPVKSLLRFRSVSKSWLSTITDPQFVKNHLYLQTENDDVSKWRIIMRYPFYNLKSCSLFSIFHEPYGFAIELNYPSKELQGTVRIVGSCNGLICISIEADTGFSIFIWNPSTRESKKLPDTSLDKSLYHYVVLGFGYDCSIDDYKVVRLSCPPSLPVVTVYSLKTDCWRQIENFPHYVVPNQSGKFVNGTLNWVGVCGARTDRSWFIVSLDLAQETYKVVPQPNYGRFKPVLRVLGGCLCIICDKGGSSVDVWIMKEYGVGESWTKLVSIPHLTERSPNTLHCSGTLWYLKDGGILVDFSGVLVMFDLKESALKYPLIYGVHDCHEVDIYVESLVSPNANNGIAR